MHRTQPSHPASLSAVAAYADRIHMFTCRAISPIGSFLERVNNSFLNLRQPLLAAPPPRPTDCLQAKCQTRLLRPSPVALRGLGSRVSRNNSVALKLDDLASAFDADVDGANRHARGRFLACARQRLPGGHLCMELRVHARGL